MNKKAQSGPIALVLLIVVFLVVLGVAGNDLFGLWEIGKTAGGLTGFEAFIFDNPAFLIILGLILGTIGWLYFGGR